MNIWFIPLSLILLLIFCGVAFAREVIRGFLDTLPIWIAAIVIIAVLFAIFCMTGVFKEKRPKCRTFYSIGMLIMILSSTIGIFAYAGPTWLDRCGRWFTWFGDGVERQLLIYICAVILIGAAFMIIAFLIPSNWISNIILLIPILLPFVLYYNALAVCSQSYSDYVTTDFVSEDTLTEYKVIRDTKIYYPSIWKNHPSLPELFPIKYAPEKFEAGEIVYAVYSSPISESAKGNYMIVSNGTIGGKVLVDDLERVEEPQYKYEIHLATEQSDLYEAVKIYKEMLGKGDDIIGVITKDSIPDGKLYVTGGDDGYLRIKLEDGSQGYISCGDVEVVRIPLTE